MMWSEIALTLAHQQWPAGSTRGEFGIEEVVLLVSGGGKGTGEQSKSDSAAKEENCGTHGCLRQWEKLQCKLGFQDCVCHPCVSPEKPVLPTLQMK